MWAHEAAELFRYSAFFLLKRLVSIEFHFYDSELIATSLALLQLVLILFSFYYLWMFAIVCSSSSWAALRLGLNIN